MSASPTAAGAKYEIRYINPAKGKGMFASQNINAGDIILQEQAQIVVDDEGDEIDVHATYDKFKNMDRNDQIHFQTLTYNEDPNHIKEWAEELGKTDDEKSGGVIGIYLTNCIRDSTTGMTYCAIESSRMNHSCNPNAATNFNEQNATVTVRALQDIPRGGEVLFAYLNVLNDKQSRQNKLEEEYGFICDCEVCSTGEELITDQCRKDLGEARDILKGIWNDAKDEKTDPRTFQIKKEMQAYEYILESTSHLPQVMPYVVNKLEKYVILLDYTKNLNRPGASRWYKEGQRLASILRGTEDAFAKRCAELLAGISL